jgi:hypothetical protein
MPVQYCHVLHLRALLNSIGRETVRRHQILVRVARQLHVYVAIVIHLKVWQAIFGPKEKPSTRMLIDDESRSR